MTGKLEPALFSQKFDDVLGGRRALDLLAEPRLLFKQPPDRLKPVMVPIVLLPPRQARETPRPLLAVAEGPGPVPTLATTRLEEALLAMPSFVKSITDDSLSLSGRYLVSIGEHKSPRIGL